MALETATYINGLVSTNPAGGDDRSVGDDHIRLLKATVQATFPNIAGAVTPTHTQLNYVAGVTSPIQTQINAFSGTFQPLDSDLTAIAALTTTSFGRGFLDLANLAALASKINALAPAWTSQHGYAPGSGVIAVAITANNAMAISISGANGETVRLAGVDPYINLAPSATGHSFALQAQSSVGGFRIFDLTAGLQRFAISNDGTATITDAGTSREVGFRHVPPILSAAGGTLTLSAADNGKCHIVTAASVITGYAADDGVSIDFIIGVASTMVAGSGTLYWAGGAGSFPTGTRNLAVGAAVTMYRYGGAWYLRGTGIS